MNNTYYEEDDVIEFDYANAMNYVREGKNMIDSLTNHCDSLIELLVVLQEVAHDVEGSTLGEDYKDFEKIMGDEGFKKYVEQIYECFEDIEQTLNSWSSVTNL